MEIGNLQPKRKIPSIYSYRQVLEPFSVILGDSR